MAQKSNKRLGPRVDPQTLSSKCRGCLIAKKSCGRQFKELLFADCQRQARVSPRDWMANTVAFGSIEEYHLVRFRYRLVAPKMAHVDASIREDEFGSCRILFGALTATTSLAIHVANLDGRRVEQGLSTKFRDTPILVLRAHTPPNQLQRGEYHFAFYSGPEGVSVRAKQDSKTRLSILYVYRMFFFRKLTCLLLYLFDCDCAFRRRSHAS